MVARFSWALPLLLATGCSPDAIIATTPRDATPDLSSDAALVCPLGTGPSMAHLGDYCIDMTEVTKAQYAAFLATSPSPLTQPPECRWNVDLLPNSKPSPSDNSCDVTADPDVNDAVRFPNRPMVCVDWCDARAYCAWAGKRLCGVRGGGSDGIVEDPDHTLNDAVRSEWFGACVGPLAKAYPYGDAYDATSCWVDATASAPIDVATRPSCHGPGGTPHAALYDLSGNVAEWTNACRPYAGDGRGETNLCHARGGWWKDDRFAGKAQACAVTPDTDLLFQRVRADSHIGFRCCY